MCLYRIAQQLKGKTIGEQILKKALTAPLHKIIENAGKDYAEIIGHIKDSDAQIKDYTDDLPPFGYDAKNNKYVPLISHGIIDPAKVTRCALENAISNAAQFITMFASIVEHVEEKK